MQIRYNGLKKASRKFNKDAEIRKEFEQLDFLDENDSRLTTFCVTHGIDKTQFVELAKTFE